MASEPSTSQSSSDNQLVPATSSQDAWYLSLLGLAEYFRTTNPPDVRSCIQCLQAIFNFQPPSRVEARTHLQLANILIEYTENRDMARNHLQLSWEISNSIHGFDEVRFEAASVLANWYEENHQPELSRPILRKAVELSNNNTYWHCRLLFQLAQSHATERDYDLAVVLLGVGVDFTEVCNVSYTKVLFMLSQCMLLMIDKKITEASHVLQQVSHMVDNWTGNPCQKEYLRVYFLVLQVCYYLMGGQVKSIKPCLKQLQQSILTVMQPNFPPDEVAVGPNLCDMFVWMPKDHLPIVVYIVTVMQCVQAGYIDKAQKYSEKALSQIERQRCIDPKPILTVFKMIILEQVVICHLISGNMTSSLQEVSQLYQLCRHNPIILKKHSYQLHTLLGLYAMSINRLEPAENQFLLALKKVKPNTEKWMFVNLNMAIIYMRLDRNVELASLMDTIKPENMPIHAHNLRAAVFFLKGMQSFFQGNLRVEPGQAKHHNEAKMFLRETLTMANAEDLNRLTSCSLVLLGHIFLSLRNTRESMNMVTPALQLASKIPDIHVQLWASAILVDLYRSANDPIEESNARMRYTNFWNHLTKDHHHATEMMEHSLIYWTGGELPELPSIMDTPNSIDGST